MVLKALVIGSRASKLALAQANLVKGLLKEKYPALDIEIKNIKTTGDKILDDCLPVRQVSLDKIGDKGSYIRGQKTAPSKGADEQYRSVFRSGKPRTLARGASFTKEIEEALLAGGIDAAVHSMKDLPVKIAAGLKIAAVTQREDSRDILVSQKGYDIKSLPQKSKVGTSSLRRRAQLLHLRPDLLIMDLRGNLDTRIKKLDDGLYDAVLLAYAGVKRLQLKVSMSVIPLEEILPQAAQGALGIEIRQDRTDIEEMAKILDDAPSHLCIDAERAVLSGLGGGCHAPIGVYAQIEGEEIIINAGVFSLDGKSLVKDKVSGSKKNSESLGLTLANKLLKSGAKEILERIG